MSKPEDTLPSLEALERKIEAVKEHHADPADKPAAPSGMNLAMRLSIEMASAVFVGGFLGYYLDQWLGSSPWFFILFFFLGAAAGTMTIMRSAQRENLDK